MKPTSAAPMSQSVCATNGLYTLITTSVFADYEIALKESLGTGISGDVRPGVHKLTKERVAVKFLHYNSAAIRELNCHTLALSKAAASRQEVEEEDEEVRSGSPSTPVRMSDEESDNGSFSSSSSFHFGDAFAANLPPAPSSNSSSSSFASSLSAGDELVVPIRAVYLNTLRVGAQPVERQCLIVVMQRIEGGDFFERISSSPQGRLCETAAKAVVRQLVLAIRHMQEHGIVHGDLKPENILMRSPDKSDWALNLTDFGLATCKPELDRLHFTPYYVSPEILMTGFRSTASDIWSLGVVLYVALLGYPPFHNQGTAHPNTITADMRRDILAGRYTVYEEDWAQVSPAAKDLIGRMLAAHPPRRPTPDEILAHPWLQH